MNFLDQVAQMPLQVGSVLRAGGLPEILKPQGAQLAQWQCRKHGHLVGDLGGEVVGEGVHSLTFRSLKQGFADLIANPLGGIGMNALWWANSKSCLDSLGLFLL